jgi:hypothetical protein
MIEVFGEEDNGGHEQNKGRFDLSGYAVIGGSRSSTFSIQTFT